MMVLPVRPSTDLTNNNRPAFSTDLTMLFSDGDANNILQAHLIGQINYKVHLLADLQFSILVQYSILPDLASTVA